jgi:hypothetical protein
MNMLPFKATASRYAKFSFLFFSFFVHRAPTRKFCLPPDSLFGSQTYGYPEPTYPLSEMPSSTINNPSSSIFHTINFVVVEAKNHPQRAIIKFPSIAIVAIIVVSGGGLSSGFSLLAFRVACHIMHPPS